MKQIMQSCIALLLAAVALVAPQPLGAERKPDSNDIGARDNPAILAQFGGEIQDADLSGYVTRIGNRLVALTDESRERWTFTVLDSPVVNAFALPGGYVYVTRGLLAIANNEAELAAVLGHEIGHVLSGHGEDRIKRGNRAGLGVIVGTILGGIIGGKDWAVDAIEFGAKIAGGYLARHSQAEELEADVIGIGLLASAGYRPYAQADFLDQFAAKERLERKVSGEQYNPNRVDFFASHPATGPRTRKAVEEARRSGLSVSDGVLSEAEYLQNINGIVYGDTAQEGFIRGLSFSHPEMKFNFVVPKGFILQNSPRQVMAKNKDGARFILDGDAKWIGPMEKYITSRWVPAISRDVPISDLRSVVSLKINGMDAVVGMADVSLPEGARIAQLVAVRFGEMTIRMVGLTSKSDGRTRNALNTAMQTFRKLSRSEITALKSYRVRIVKVDHMDTIRSLARNMPLTGLREEQFKAMNGYGPGDELMPGDLVKIVE